MDQVQQGFLFCLCCLVSQPSPANQQYPLNPGDFIPEVIYGEDDRRDLYAVKNPAWLKLADSTVALFSSGRVKIDAKMKIAKLSTTPYGRTLELCRDEPFYTQPMGSFCSGSLVGPDLVLTAGHCFDSDIGCLDTRFVFGFGIKQKGKYPKSVPADEVYSCAKLVAHYDSETGADYALVQLDRAVPNHEPLPVNKNGDLTIGTPLLVIGHPSGLPTKIANGANVREVIDEYVFSANLDTYAGNSGSAVFNVETGQIEGVLISGETDFRYRDSCTVSNRCKDNECDGEKVTRASVFAKWIP